MNIQAITPNFQIKNSAEKNNQNNRHVILTNSLNYLSRDTVSFSGKEKITHTFTDVIREAYNDKVPQYTILGTRLMDTLEAIANKLKEDKVSFDREYCEETTVKSTKSFLSKLKRSGESPMDKIRSTLFVANPYDLKLINNKILPELKSRGYEILMVPDKMSGKRVLTKKPDCDVRLADITDENVQNLDEHLRQCIGKPQKSGYEDIQMRLIDTTESGRKKTPIELIILFGKNYAEAKHNESYYVYDITRALSGELHVASVKNPEMYSPAKRILNNIEIIKGQLNSFISKPLFINAKNIDFYHEKFQLPVELSKSTCEALNGLIEGIRAKIHTHYKDELTKVQSQDYNTELEKLIKASHEFKERDTKTIFVDDIKEKRKELIKTLKEQKTEDLALIKRVQERFTETVEKYGRKD